MLHKATSGDNSRYAIGCGIGAAIMRGHFGERETAKAALAAIESVLAEPPLGTRDLGGTANTVSCDRPLPSG